MEREDRDTEGERNTANILTRLFTKEITMVQ